MECIVEGDLKSTSKLSLKWLNHEESYRTNDYGNNQYYDITTLEITNATKSNSGTYTCIRSISSCDLRKKTQASILLKYKGMIIFMNKFRKCSCDILFDFDEC